MQFIIVTICVIYNVQLYLKKKIALKKFLFYTFNEIKRRIDMIRDDREDANISDSLI